MKKKKLGKPKIRKENNLRITRLEIHTREGKTEQDIVLPNKVRGECYTKRVKNNNDRRGLADKLSFESKYIKRFRV